MIDESRSDGDECPDRLWDVDAERPLATRHGRRDERERDRDREHDQHAPSDGWRPVAAGLAVTLAIVATMSSPFSP